MPRTRRICSGSLASDRCDHLEGGDNSQRYKPSLRLMISIQPNKHTNTTFNQALLRWPEETMKHMSSFQKFMPILTWHSDFETSIETVRFARAWRRFIWSALLWITS